MEDFLYIKIYNDLKEKIVTGALRTGDRVPTEKELIKEYGVSRITAIKAMQKLEQEKLITRIRSKGSFVRYEDVSSFGSFGKAQSFNSKTFAFVAPCNEDIVISTLSGFQKVAISHGYGVSIFDTSQKSITDADVLRIIGTAGGYCGIVFKPTLQYDILPELTYIMKSGTPLVLIDSNLPMLNVPCVKSNNYLGGYKITQKFIEYGHRNIGMVFSKLYDLNEKERFGGYLRALTENNIDFSFDNLFLFDNDHLRESLDCVGTFKPLLITEKLSAVFSRPNPPTALVFQYDDLAAKVEQLAFEAGFKIPQSFSISGYNNAPICDQMIVPLTSVDQNYLEIAEKVFEVLMDITAGKPIKLEYLIEPQIVIRESIRNLNN